MSVELLDGSTITNFIEDEAFETWITNRFDHLDINKDGMLSYEEILPEMKDLRVHKKDLEPDAHFDDMTNDYSLILSQFDRQSNGKVGKEDFKAEIKRIMLAIAESLGSVPMFMALEAGGLLMKAVETELVKF